MVVVLVVDVDRVPLLTPAEARELIALLLGAGGELEEWALLLARRLPADG